MYVPGVCIYVCMYDMYCLLSGTKLRNRKKLKLNACQRASASVNGGAGEANRNSHLKETEGEKKSGGKKTQTRNDKMNASLPAGEATR